MYYWGRLSVVVHEAAAASGLPESNSQPSRAGACSCCVCSDTQGQQGCCYQLLSLARHGRAHTGCCWQVAINLANQQLSEEGSVLLLQGIHFLLQVDWYSCTSIFQHSSAKSVRSGWSRRDFSSAKARQNCSAGAGTSLQILPCKSELGWELLECLITLEGIQGIKIYRGKHQVSWSAREKIRIWGGIWWIPGVWLHCAVSWSHEPGSKCGSCTRGYLKLKAKLSWRVLLSVPCEQSRFGKAGISAVHCQRQCLKECRMPVNPLAGPGPGVHSLVAGRCCSKF